VDMILDAIQRDAMVNLLRHKFFLSLYNDRAHRAMVGWEPTRAALQSFSWDFSERTISRVIHEPADSNISEVLENGGRCRTCRRSHEA
jgi:hypothetical protein